MTKKIYLEAFKKCPGSLRFPLLFDVNRHIVYAMRSSGLGYSGIERFTSFINMPR